ncbi:hypothetical protein KIN20_018746 [Parelaphostrongylus tenuis]|uniref:Uncharacterized protein n=1 Tax=Parelaphostrongylus tenuis TaxID=148309 RepID=A0AAD5MNG7_PARTN|nr:hypothetical protein KIN20_018746 [Parelaphostrongylus tenuis]
MSTCRLSAVSSTAEDNSTSNELDDMQKVIALLQMGLAALQKDIESAEEKSVLRSIASNIQAYQGYRSTQEAS